MRDGTSGQPHHGNSPERQSWGGFIFGFVLVAVLVFFNLRMPFAQRFWPHVVETIFVAAPCGWLVGRYGDVALAKILVVFRWF